MAKKNNELLVPYGIIPTPNESKKDLNKYIFSNVFIGCNMQVLFDVVIPVPKFTNGVPSIEVINYRLECDALKPYLEVLIKSACIDYTDFFEKAKKCDIILSEQLTNKISLPSTFIYDYLNITKETFNNHTLISIKIMHGLDNNGTTITTNPEYATMNGNMNHNHININFKPYLPTQ
ncbi:hypothetical protein ACTFIW_003659 [Dictyostelium discoideum]